MTVSDDVVRAAAARGVADAATVQALAAEVVALREVHSLAAFFRAEAALMGAAAGETPRPKDYSEGHYVGTMKTFRACADEIDQAYARGFCHCGRPLYFGFDGDPTHHRGMCEGCDSVRCDAYPQDCPYPLGA